MAVGLIACYICTRKQASLLLVDIANGENCRCLRTVLEIGDWRVLAAEAPFALREADFH